jgi:membrane-bound lytic murein transglycosylase D
MRGWLRRLGTHRPVIEQVLVREGLPPGLIFVAMIESGFTSGALSSKGAGGFWQFTPAVARAYGLEVSFWVDERRDLEKSTAAAARYLGDLYQRFGNWELALSGYNAGVFAVLDSILRYNTNDYWTLCSVEAGLPSRPPSTSPRSSRWHRRSEPQAFGFDDVVSEQPPAWDLIEAPRRHQLRRAGQRGATSRRAGPVEPDLRAAADAARSAGGAPARARRPRASWGALFARSARRSGPGGDRPGRRWRAWPGPAVSARAAPAQRHHRRRRT